MRSEVSVAHYPNPCQATLRNLIINRYYNNIDRLWAERSPLWLTINLLTLPPVVVMNGEFTLDSHHLVLS